MNNKILKSLILTMFTVTLFVGCGGNDTTSNKSNTEVENVVTTNSESEDSLATIQSGVTYVEGEYYFAVPSEEYLDDTYVDGETLDVTSWKSVNQIITINESINMFDADKRIMGYLKPEIECVYISTNGEWSRITYGTDLLTSKGSVIVKTDDLMTVMEVNGMVP